MISKPFSGTCSVRVIHPFDMPWYSSFLAFLLFINFCPLLQQLNLVFLQVISTPDFCVRCFILTFSFGFLFSLTLCVVGTCASSFLPLSHHHPQGYLQAFFFLYIFSVSCTTEQKISKNTGTYIGLGGPMWRRILFYTLTKVTSTCDTYLAI